VKRPRGTSPVHRQAAFAVSIDWQEQADYHLPVPQHCLSQQRSTKCRSCILEKIVSLSLLYHFYFNVFPLADRLDIIQQVSIQIHQKQPNGIPLSG
jgi:hypothetical protein